MSHQVGTVVWINGPVVRVRGSRQVSMLEIGGIIDSRREKGHHRGMGAALHDGKQHVEEATRWW